MIYVSTTEIRPYYNKVTIETTSGTNIVYTDTPSQYENMVNKFNHIKNVTVELNTLTEDQQQRLNGLQLLKGSISSKHEPQANNFVQYGYISPFGNIDPKQGEVDPFQTILPKYEGVVKESLLSAYKDILASVRYDRECGGIKFNGMEAFTDKQAQASITSTITLLQLSGMKSTKFKFVDGWQELDLNGIIQLGVTVATHVQICFNVEEQLNAKFKLLTLKELASYASNPYESTQEAGEDITVTYNTLVDQLEASMA